MRRISNAKAFARGLVSRQRELFPTRRRPRPPALDPDEREIQIAVIQHYHARRRPGVVCWHTPNQAAQDNKPLAALLKAMGVLPGVADLVCTFPACPEPVIVTTSSGHTRTVERLTAPLLFLELKARGRTLSADQRVFRDLMRAHG